MTEQETEKGFDIIVNGTRFRVAKDQVSFDQVVDLAFPDDGRGSFHVYPG